MLQTLLLRAGSRLAALAQLVERSFRKAQVTGSSPVGGFDTCHSAWRFQPPKRCS